ncbi:hypothetical protein [Natrialba sp. PRR66]|uniref:hypothetical protein n=1 Tax=Natrialba sp. PRR66 TaxID=3098146 RepID=UPI002B1D3A96|nr:hypothetical protein [Natrialba sp. PRR66]
MSVKAVVVAIGAGIAAFLGIGLGVTEITGHWVAYPQFLGLPAGFVTGAVATIGVALKLADDTSDGRPDLAGAMGGFAVGLVGGILIAAGTIFGAVSSLGVGVVLGLVVAIAIARYR